MLYRGLAALTMQPLPSVVSPKFTNESWLIMYSVIFIRHDLPEDTFYFPSVRRTTPTRNLQKCPLNIYDAPAMLKAKRTDVRYGDLPPS